MFHRLALKFFSLCVLFIAISMIFCISAASYLVVKPLDFVAPDASPISAEVVLTAELVSVDATRRILDMNWYPGLPAGCTAETSHFVADIYFNPDLLDPSSPSFTSLPPFSPVFQLNASQFCGGTSPVASMTAFRTVTKLFGSNLNPQINTKPSTLQEYPFDVYDAKFSIYALDHDHGQVISLNVTKSYGVAFNFEVTATRTFLEGNIMPYLQISLQVSRSKAVKAFVIIVAVSSWLAAAAFLAISAATLIYPDPRHCGIILVSPIGILFAFTSIRENLPGAPKGFGARIDVYTILPILVVVSLCSFFLITIVFLRRLVEGKSGSSSLSNLVKIRGTGPSMTSDIAMQTLISESEHGIIATLSIDVESPNDQNSNDQFTKGGRQLGQV